MTLIGIIIALIIFSIVIIIHEFGHFFAARKFGVKVLEFGLGIPPKAKELFKDKLGTIYTLNRLPLGGFVRLDGENNETKKLTKDKTKFYNKNYFQKSIILLAGVFMNFLLAGIIFSIIFFIGTKPFGINTVIENNLNSKIIPTYNEAIKSGIIIKNKGVVLKPTKGSLAQKSGIKSGDILVEIFEKCNLNNPSKCKSLGKINNYKDLTKILKNNKNKEIIFLLKDKYKKQKFSFLKLDNKGKIGAYISDNIELNKNFEYKFSLIDSIKYGFYETYTQSILTIKGLKIFFHKIFYPKEEKERKEALEQMSGPIGIVDFIAKNFNNGIKFLAILAAIISINVGIFNLLPIPALDGGRWFLLTINTIINKLTFGRIKLDNFELILHLIFFIILIALSIFIGYNDITKIINK